MMPLQPWSKKLSISNGVQSAKGNSPLTNVCTFKPFLTNNYRPKIKQTNSKTKLATSLMEWKELKNGWPRRLHATVPNFTGQPLPNKSLSSKRHKKLSISK